MANTDYENIKNLIEWITEHADYEDTSDLCEQLGVDEEWFDKYYD